MNRAALDRRYSLESKNIRSGTHGKRGRCFNDPKSIRGRNVVKGEAPASTHRGFVSRHIRGREISATLMESLPAEASRHQLSFRKNVQRPVSWSGLAEIARQYRMQEEIAVLTFLITCAIAMALTLATIAAASAQQGGNFCPSDGSAEGTMNCPFATLAQCQAAMTGS